MESWRATSCVNHYMDVLHLLNMQEMRGQSRGMQCGVYGLLGVTPANAHISDYGELKSSSQSCDFDECSRRAARRQEDWMYVILLM